jgi:prepilin-type N-terminal cleavage/methylation domain-containing protein/prepilin-type processing-associated H-X9-DG protein
MIRAGEMSGFPSIGRKGFTLVELLVVIAIIAILMALLMPAMRMAREKAKITTCQNNLHQLGIAMEMYKQQYEKLPYWLGGDRSWGDGYGWLEKLARVALDAENREIAPPDICVCPGMRQFGYSCNQYYFSTPGGVDYRKTKMIIAIYDIGPRFWLTLNRPSDEIYKYETDLSDEYRGMMGFLWWPGMIPPHQGGHNILFSDGHVRWFREWDSRYMTRGANY